MKFRPPFLAFTLAPLAATALDLTPEVTSRELEGIRIPMVCFADAGKKIAFQPPAQWNLSGGGNVLSLYPPDSPDAFMQLRVHPRQPLPAGQTEDLEAWCRSHLPPDGADFKVENEVENPFNLGVLPSREFTYSYSAQGRRFVTSVTAVDWNDRERLAVVVTARASDFKALHESAMRSMFSWQTQ